MNRSPGNIKDGLIADAMKSAGAAKKRGTSPVADVLDYPEKVTRPRFNLLCTPGNDVKSTTAEVTGLLMNLKTGSPLALA
jgi:altronate hydrolase